MHEIAKKALTELLGEPKPKKGKGWKDIKLAPLFRRALERKLKMDMKQIIELLENLWREHGHSEEYILVEPPKPPHKRMPERTRPLPLEHAPQALLQALTRDRRPL